MTQILAGAPASERSPEAVAPAATAERAAATRLAWLDQYRGYTMLGMFVVNFVGSFAAMPAVLKHHHTYCSYADTIMPQFLFAVGFGFRLTFLRRLAQAGWWSAAGHAVSRNLALILVGFIVYGLGRRVSSWADITAVGDFSWPAAVDLALALNFRALMFELSEIKVLAAVGLGIKRELFQTLVHIGVTSLWVLPVIAARGWVRIAWMAGSAGLHLWLSWAGYYEWVLATPAGIDGGPLGFLTWTMPLLVGSLACDALAERRIPASWLLLPAVGLMVLGYSLSCRGRSDPAPLPLVSPSQAQLKEMNEQKNLWTMSQRAGSITYLAFGAGFALAVAVLFVWLVEGLGWSWSLLTTLGRNALVGYVLHGWISTALKPWAPRDVPLWYALVALAVFLVLNCLFLRHLEKQRLFLRL